MCFMRARRLELGRLGLWGPAEYLTRPQYKQDDYFDILRRSTN